MQAVEKIKEERPKIVGRAIGGLDGRRCTNGPLAVDCLEARRPPGSQAFLIFYLP